MGSVPAAAATGLGGILTGEGFAEALRATQDAAGIPKDLQQGTLRTALMDLGEAVEAGREARVAHADTVRYRIRAGANGVQRIEGLGSDDEPPAPGTTATAVAERPPTPLERRRAQYTARVQQQPPPPPPAAEQPQQPPTVQVAATQPTMQAQAREEEESLGAMVPGTTPGAAPSSQVAQR